MPTNPWRLILRPQVVMAFDDVSIPLPPMRSPDIRHLVMDLAERYCIEEGITDITFICSIALHRFIRPDEFRHICGPRLFDKYFKQGRMKNYNAVDEEFGKHLGFTEAGEDVLVCREFVEADLAIYANCNYVSMDGGYKSYATGEVAGMQPLADQQQPAVYTVQPPHSGVS